LFVSTPDNGSAHSAWDRFVGFLVHHRLITLIFAMAVTAMSAAVSPRIETTGDPTAYLPMDRKEVRDWISMNERFGALSMLMVGIEEPGDPLTPDSLARLARITDRLNEHKADGILLARSLTNVETLQVGDDGTIHAGLMVPSIPRKDDGIRDLSARILADMQVPGSLVSRDLKGYVILVTPDSRKDLRTVSRLVRDVVEFERGPMQAHYFGAPFISDQVTRQVYAKLPWIVPVFGLLLFGVILLRVRYVKAVFLVLSCSGLALVWWLAFMDIAGYALSMTSVNGLLLLLVVGMLTFARGAQLRLEARRNTLPRPVIIVLSGAFLAFVAVALFGRLTPVSLPYLALFGEAMAIGIVAVSLVGIFVFVPLSSYLDPRLNRRREEPAPQISRKIGSATLLVMLLLGLYGTSNLRFAIGLDDIFLESDAVGTTLSFFDRHFGGNEFIQLDVKGDLRDPAVCARVMRLTDLLEGNGAFSDVRSITQVLGFLAHNFSGSHSIPTDRESLNNLWFFLEGNGDIRPLVTDERDEAMLALRVHAHSPASLKDIVSSVEWAIDSSRDIGTNSAGPRLDALANLFEVTLPEGRVDEVLAAAVSPPGQTGIRHRKILEELHEYMLSPSSPFSPTDEDWESIANVVLDREDGHAGKTARAIADTTGFADSGMPETVADSLADMLISMADSADRRLRSDILTNRLFEGLDRDAVPVQMLVRTRGVFTDILSPAPRALKGDTQFAVSGFPVILPMVESELLGGVLTTAGIVILVCFLIALFAAPRPGLGMTAAGEALLASLSTFALGWALGLQVDSGSATLYLLPPTIMFLLSPSLHRSADGEVRRFPVAFALGLAAASLSLLLTGVLPVMRIGGVMAIGMISATIVASLSRRLTA